MVTTAERPSSPAQPWMLTCAGRMLTRFADVAPRLPHRLQTRSQTGGGSRPSVAQTDRQWHDGRVRNKVPRQRANAPGPAPKGLTSMQHDRTADASAGASPKSDARRLIKTATPGIYKRGDSY